MSMNRAINATIALIEGRTDIAKEVFRDPTSDVKNVPEVLARLEVVVNKAAAKAIRNGLVRALALQPVGIPKKDSAARAENEKCFFDGVNSVEKLFGGIAYELEQG
jgi:hypothetical protein